MSDLHFALDGQSLAFVVFEMAGQKVRQRLVIEGPEGRTEGEWHDSVLSPTFDPEGPRVAYIAVDGKESRLVVGDQSYDAPGARGPIRFCADGKRLGYVSREDGEWWWRVAPR